jgi:pSer/pThr/pTyr-binding forkhead associated (FHA) protein
MDDDSTTGKYLGRLSLTKSDGSMRYFNIKRSILIGRGAECDIRIKVKTVSRIHCKVNLETDGVFMLENISTTNFTIVNNTEVGKSVKLNDGDIITVAERDFIFQLIENEPTASPTVDFTDVPANKNDSSMGIYTIFCGTAPKKGDKEEDDTCTVM